MAITPVYTPTLINPHLDETTYNYENIPELTCPKGWIPFWRNGTPTEIADGYWKRPEFKPEPLRLHGGKQGEKWFSTYATHDAGLLQVVPCTKGAHLTLSAWGQFWSENDDKSGGSYALTIGIDPWGATDPFAKTVIWAPWIGQDVTPNWRKGDTWLELVANADALADKITVYLRGTCKWRARHNDAYFDDVNLTADPVPTPTPTPTPNDDWLKILDTRLIAIEDIVAKINRDVSAIRGHFA